MYPLFFVISKYFHKLACANLGVMGADKVYNFYCDESCHLRNDGKQFMILGYISVPDYRTCSLKKELKILRTKYKNTLEVKWTYLNEWNFEFYSRLVDWFFSRSDIRFRAIIVDKYRYIKDKCGDDYDKFYYLMYYQLIYHMLDTGVNYNIYLDIKDNLSHHRITELQKILNVQMGVIKKIQHVRSHELDLLQLCDLLIGAISYHLNHTAKSSLPKLRLIEKIRNRSRTDLENTTGKSFYKFNLFRIRI